MGVVIVWYHITPMDAKNVVGLRARLEGRRDCTVYKSHVAPSGEEGKVTLSVAGHLDSRTIDILRKVGVRVNY